MKLSFKHLMALPSGNYNLLMYVANVDEFYLFSTVDPVVSERGCASYTQGKAKITSVMETLDGFHVGIIFIAVF